MSNQTSSDNNLLKRLLTLAVGHFKALYLELDPVKEGRKYNRDVLLNDGRVHSQQRTSTSKRQLNLVYLFPTLLMLYINLDSYYIYLRVHFGGYFDLLEGLFAHRLFPRALWRQSDPMWQMALWMTLTIYGCLLSDRGLDGKCLMYVFANGSSVEIIQNGRVLEQSESTQIVTYRNRMKHLMPTIMTIVAIHLALFILYNFYQNFTLTSGHDIIQLIILLPFIFYLPITNFYMIYYFGLTSKYLRIKQTCKVAKYDRLWKRMNRKPTRKGSIWNEFQSINRDIATLHEEIRSQNQFWSKYLTIYFAVYIFEICYFIYVIFFAPNEGGLVIDILKSITVQFIAILLYITLQGSRIVYRNVTAHREAQQMGRQLATSGGLKLGQRLKIDLLVAEYKNVADSCFKLSTGHPINSTMFQVLFSYTTLFFMMLFKDQEKIE